MKMAATTAQKTTRRLRRSMFWISFKPLATMASRKMRMSADQI